MLQEIITFTVVGIALLSALFSFYKAFVAKPLSKFLLKKGRVSLAMKMRSQAQESGCGSCGSDSSCHTDKIP
jgi:hypothetical protein